MTEMTKHKHVEILRAIADGREVEGRYDDSFQWCINNKNFNPIAFPDYEWRIKPHTININGHEVPEPVREPLVESQSYWIPLLGAEPLCEKLVWNRNAYDFRVLSLGLIHLSKEAAEAHTKALLSFTEVK